MFDERAILKKRVKGTEGYDEREESNEHHRIFDARLARSAVL